MNSISDNRKLSFGFKVRHLLSEKIASRELTTVTAKEIFSMRIEYYDSNYELPEIISAKLNESILAEIDSLWHDEDELF